MSGLAPLALRRIHHRTARRWGGQILITKARWVELNLFLISPENAIITPPRPVIDLEFPDLEPAWNIRTSSSRLL
jgi:hypothetical protein